MKSLSTLVLALVFVSSAQAATQCVKPAANDRKTPEQLAEKLKSEGEYTFPKVLTTKGDCYEIYGKDKDGKKVEIYFDQGTLEPVKMSREGKLEFDKTAKK